MKRSLALLLLAALAADVGTTLLFHALGVQEGNPLLGGANLSVWRLLWTHAAIAGVGLWLIPRARRLWPYWGLTCFFAAVVAWNVLAIVTH